MKQLPFELDPDPADQPAIGLIVLQSDETLEHELKQWLPNHYRLFHTRIANDQCIDESSLQAMQAELPATAAMLPSNTEFRVVAYGCTSASTVIGAQTVERVVQSVHPNALVTNPLSAIVANLQHLKARRIALLTPYVPEVCAALIKQLEALEFDISACASFHEAMDHRVARISQQSLEHALRELASDASADAVVASCTNLRTYNLITSTSDLCGCPIISSNSALAWHIRSLLGDAE